MMQVRARAGKGSIGVRWAGILMRGYFRVDHYYFTRYLPLAAIGSERRV